jgi:hypothetical protein
MRVTKGIVRLIDPDQSGRSRRFSLLHCEPAIGTLPCPNTSSMVRCPGFVTYGVDTCTSVGVITGAW